MLKKVLIVIGAVVALLIVIALVLPLFINANTFKPTLESDLSSALGRKVDIGNISLSVLSGSVSVDSFSVADDPAFSSSPFLTAKQLSAGVSVFPLIFSKRLEVTSFTITDPQVTLLRSPSGRWNYSSLGTSRSSSSTNSAASPQPPATSQTKAQPSSSSSSAANNFSVDKLKLTNGTMTVGTVGSGRTQKYEDVDLDASNVSYTAQFPFQLSVKTPGGGSVTLDGKAGPVNSSDASLTPFDATLKVQNLDLASTGFIEPSAGVGGVIGFDGTLASDGREMTSKGTLKAEKIRCAPDGAPATVPVNVDYATTYDLQHSTGSLTQGQIHIGKAVANLSGTYNAAGTTPTVDMKMDGKGMPVPDLEGVLPAVGVKLPSGASLQSGGLNLTLAITGPIDKLVITGPVNLSNAKLAGFNLTGKLGALASFAGIGKGGSADTEIQTLSANLRVDPQGTHAQNLDLIVPSIGTMTGNGNVSSSGQLDCKMVAKLGTKNVAGMVGTALTSFTGGGSSGGGIPFKITGTTSAPVFAPDFGGMAGNPVKGATGTAKGAAGTAQSLLGGFLKKKQKQQP